MPLLWVDRVRRTKEPPTANRGKTPPTDPLTPRERRVMLIVIGVVVGLVAAGAIAWAIIGRSSVHDTSPTGCVDVAIASSMGGSVEHVCGPAARDWCRAVSAQHDTHAQAVQAQCRVAGILP
jgi:hypothetical protein